MGEPGVEEEDSGKPRRPHTGRRRNEAARDAILDATIDLIYAGSPEVTIDAIAHHAGVGRQTIYRWWPSKGAVAAEALARHAQTIVPARDTGSFRADLESFLADSFTALTADDNLRTALRRIAAAAQSDEHVAVVLAEFTARRRAALRDLLERGTAAGDLSPKADIAMLVDMAYGVLWYRVLVGHAPLDEAAARDLAACLLAAGAP